MTSFAFTDIRWASSPTVILSGIWTSLTMGAVGISKPCWGAVCLTTAGLLFWRFFLRPDMSVATCNSCQPCLPCLSLSADFLLGAGFPSFGCLTCSLSWIIVSVATGSTGLATAAASDAVTVSGNSSPVLSWAVSTPTAASWADPAGGINSLAASSFASSSALAAASAFAAASAAWLSSRVLRLT